MTDHQFDLHMQMLSAILNELQGIRGMMVKDRSPLTPEELNAQYERFKAASARDLAATLSALNESKPFSDKPITPS